MMRSIVRTLLLISIATLTVSCATTSRSTTNARTAPVPPPPPASQAAEPAPEPGAPAPARIAGPPFESADFVVTFARAGDTMERLAERHLGDAGKAWMIRDYAGVRTLADGDEVVIPKREWNATGVDARGYQLVPVLVYHNLNPQPRRPLTMSPRVFEEQMRYLHAEGFTVITLREFLDFTAGQKQLPRKSVLITFDDGYSSFLTYAYPVLKELGFRATLFVYTDFVGAGANALTWQNLKDLTDEGFEVQAHSKTHTDLRRRPNESLAAHAKRMEAELSLPQLVFRKQLGRASETLAYPFGAADDEVRRHVMQSGYTSSFTVRGQANPSFAAPFAMSRVQVYSDVSLADFARLLATFHDSGVNAPALDRARLDGADVFTVERLAALHHARGAELEQQGHLREAMDQQLIALTIDPGNEPARTALERVKHTMAAKVAQLAEQSHDLLQRGSPAEARERNLAILAIDPANRPAFEALRTGVREPASVMRGRATPRDTGVYITHTVRAGDTLSSLAARYYGDSSRAADIATLNDIASDATLVAGRQLRIRDPILPQ